MPDTDAESIWKNPWIRAGAGLAGLTAVALLALALSQVLVPLAMAFIVAYILNPVCNWLERRGLRRTMAIGLIAFAGLLLIAIIPLYFIPTLISETDRLVQQARETAAEQGAEDRAPFLQRVEAWALDRLPLDEMVTAWSLREITEMDDDAPAEQVIGRFVNQYLRENALSIIRSNIRALVDWGQWAGSSAVNIFSRLGQGIIAVVLFLLNVALFGFVAGYLLKDYDRVVEHAHDMVPVPWQPAISRIALGIDHQLQAFFRGQVMVMGILAVIYSIGFLICGVPFAITIAIIGGLLNIVPYLGPLLTYIPVALLTWMAYGFDWRIAGAMLTIFLAQALESNVLTPNIVGSQVGLHPVWVILAVIVFSTFFGFVGLLLAVPIAATLKVLVLEGVAWYKDSRYYRGAASAG